MNRENTPDNSFQLPRFVVQWHSSRSPHYDFRLEKNGVFVSWAVPKGLPTEIDQQRLALKVEDHDLSFWDFEGIIPAGEPGAGIIKIMDRGSYKLIVWDKDEIKVEILGSLYRGTYKSDRFKNGGPRAWLIRKL